jgi:hypothetical protein
MGQNIFKLFVRAIALIAVICAAGAKPAVAEGRVALVVGNDAYQSLSKLANPGADAGELASVLAANGFEVISCDGKRPGCFDLTREGLQDALRFSRRW